MLKQRPGFTLVGLLVSLSILVMCSVAAAFYYQSIIEEHQITATKSKLREIRDAFMIWQSRNLGKEPASIDEMDNLGRSDEATLDAWKTKIKIDYERRLIVSAGPDREFDESVTESNDDITEALPPAVVLSEGAVNQPVSSQQKPIITKVYPTGPVPATNLEIGAEYRASGSPIDLSTLWFTIDGENVSSDSRLYDNRCFYEPKTPLTTGTHSALLKIQDMNGNFMARPWTFYVTP